MLHFARFQQNALIKLRQSSWQVDAETMMHLYDAILRKNILHTQLYLENRCY